MPKIILTIKSSYLPEWGTYEGVRELIQNARDALIEQDAPMSVELVGNTLRIENTGTTMPLQALLLGHTSKVGNSEMIGKFGEGLKLGVLALVRAGNAVKIRNGSEVWSPSLEFDERFGEKVLAFQIDGGRTQKNRVRIEVEGIKADEWIEWKHNFLFLNPPQDAEMSKTSYGTVLLSDRFKGRIYVKGIFVQTHRDAVFGYDLSDAQLDRDRKMVESWNLAYHTRRIFMSATNAKHELFGQFNACLRQPSLETEGISTYNDYEIPSELATKVAESFMEEHGPEAFPVTTIAEAKEVEPLGRKGIVVTGQQSVVLSKAMGDLHALKESLKKEASNFYSWGDLSEIQQRHLVGAIGLISEVEPLMLEQIDVVDFRSDALKGQFSGDRIRIAKSILSDFDDTLRVLVHEIAHKSGGDGAYTHTAQIERIYIGIVRNMRSPDMSRFTLTLA